MTKQEIQQRVDRLAQEYIKRMRAAYVKRDVELQLQVNECRRQQGLARRRLAELDLEARRV